MSRATNVVDRLWARVNKSGRVAREGMTPCWEWQGSCHKSGHGQIGTVGKPRVLWVHRLSWELVNGPIPAGQCVCHRCDNPPCVNPDHMFLGTRAENLKDMWSKSRGVKNLQNLRAGDDTRRRKSPLDGRIEAIFLRCAEGVGLKTLAAEFGSRPGTIYAIIRRANWKHVPIPEELVTAAQTALTAQRGAPGVLRGPRRHQAAA